MNLYLTKHRSGVRQDITNLAVSWTWSGDKASLSRQLEMELAFSEKDNLPVPEIGDLVTMEATKPLFAGVVLRRTLGSEDHTLSVTCFDYGIYLQKNDCTAKFTGATPEEITRSLCGNKGIPVAALPTSVINSVAIYDKNGNFLRRLGDTVSQELVGTMETHITQQDHSDAADEANRLLEDGTQQRTVTVRVLGDLSLITGETVVVRESKTGLTGIFWIDADVHTWNNHNYYAMLTLNCRNVAATASAGSEME